MRKSYHHGLGMHMPFSHVLKHHLVHHGVHGVYHGRTDGYHTHKYGQPIAGINNVYGEPLPDLSHLGLGTKHHKKSHSKSHSKSHRITPLKFKF